MSKNPWRRALIEEIIAVLWIIAALLAFLANYPTWGWVFAIKAICDFLMCIWFSLKDGIEEVKKEREAKKRMQELFPNNPVKP